MRAAIVLAITVTLCHSTVEAEPIVLSATGTLRRACCWAAGGDPFAFTFAIEAISVDHNTDPELGEFSLGTGTFSLRLGSLNITGASTATASVSNSQDFGAGSVGDSIVFLVDSLDAAHPLHVWLGASSIDPNWLIRDEWPSDVVATFNLAESRQFYLLSNCDWCEDPLADSWSLRLSYGFSAAPVPEPATIALLGLGLAGLGARRWQQRKPR